MSEPIIEFEWETIEEVDCDWSALFVRIDKGNWVLAKAAFNTEDQEHIIELIKSNGTGNWQ